MSSRRRTAVAALGIAALALAVRLAFAAAFARTPIGASIFLDSKTYDDLGVALLRGTGPALEPFFVEPLYGYFLAVVYGAFGRGLWAVRILQALGGALTCVLIFDLARRLYSRRAGIVAGCAAALYGPFVFYDAMLLKTSGEVLCAALLLWLLVRAVEEGERTLPWAAAGLLLGIAATLKANFLVLAPVALAAPWLAPAASRRRRLGRAAWVAGGIALAVLPILVRNSALAGEPTFLTTGAGMNFYQGNREGTDGGLDIPEFIQLDPAREQEDSLAEARRRTGVPDLTPGAASRFWVGESLAFIRAQPTAWLRLMGRKALLFWNRYEAADDLSFHYTRRVVPLLWLAPVGFWLVAPLGLAGTLAGAGGDRREWLLRSAVVLLAAGTILFHVADRYRLAALPALIVLAVGFARRAGLAWTSGARRAALLCVLGAAGCALVVDLPDLYPGGQDMAPFDRIMALGYRERGDERAAAYADRAADSYARKAAGALRRGEAYRAEIYLVNALSVRPEDPESWYRLGLARERLGHADEALAAYREAAAAPDRAVAALTRMGRLYLEAQRPRQAEAALRRGLDLAPDDPGLLVVLGDLRALEGRYEDALALFERALAADPEAEPIRRRIEAARARLDAEP